MPHGSEPGRRSPSGRVRARSRKPRSSKRRSTSGGPSSCRHVTSPVLADSHPGSDFRSRKERRTRPPLGRPRDSIQGFASTSASAPTGMSTGQRPGARSTRRDAAASARIVTRDVGQSRAVRTAEPGSRAMAPGAIGRSPGRRTVMETSRRGPQAAASAATRTAAGGSAARVRRITTPGRRSSPSDSARLFRSRRRTSSSALVAAAGIARRRTWRPTDTAAPASSGLPGAARHPGRRLDRGWLPSSRSDT